MCYICIPLTAWSKEYWVEVSPLKRQSNQQKLCFHCIWQLHSVYLAESSSESTSSGELRVKFMSHTKTPKEAVLLLPKLLRRTYFPSRVRVAPLSLESKSIAYSLCVTTPPGGGSSLCSEDRLRRQVTWTCEHRGLSVNSSCWKLGSLQHELYSLLSFCRGDRLSVISRLATR